MRRGETWSSRSQSSQDSKIYSRVCLGVFARSRSWAMDRSSARTSPFFGHFSSRCGPKSYTVHSVFTFRVENHANRSVCDAPVTFPALFRRSLRENLRVRGLRAALPTPQYAAARCHSGTERSSSSPSQHTAPRWTNHLHCRDPLSAASPKRKPPSISASA